jgi:hypothetical protein
MTRYFFDILDGAVLTRDDDGADLPDAAAMQVEAKVALADVVRDAMPNGPSQTFRVNVRDEDGRDVYEAQLALTTRDLSVSI